MATATLAQTVTLVLSREETEELADYLYHVGEHDPALLRVRIEIENALRPPKPA